MSYLYDLIKNVRQKVRAASGSPEQLRVAVSTFKQEVTSTISELYKADNLRIFDGEAGGVLRGPRKARAQREDKNTGNLLCQNKYFTDNKLEVPYFKAVFNLPNHSFKASDVTVRMIGYESPLMRKKREKDNKNISSRAISCDLVGLTPDDRVLCIEGKVNPHNVATDIVYGILESFAYGVCIEYFVSDQARKELFKKEVRACAAEFHPNGDHIYLDNCSAAYSLAAPIEYFSEYFCPQKITKKRAERRLDEASKIVDVLKNIKGPHWGGFLLLRPTCDNGSIDRLNARTVNGFETVEPRFGTRKFECLVANDIDDLETKSRFSGAAK